MKIAIIAEKPSVARDIARMVGATEKKDGYIQGNGYMVTWAFGHLVGLVMPDHYGWQGYKKENLPMIPKPFVIEPRKVKEGKTHKIDPGAKKQLNAIKAVFMACDEIIVATDAGREGELIFRYIYNYLNCKKPFKRLWINSLTDKAIKEGLANLKEGHLYDNLYMAAKGRSEADWLVGLNGSQALSIAAGSGSWSVGRVQTPTLKIICSRYLENKSFKTTPYWQLKLSLVKDDISFSLLSERYEAKEVATVDYQRGLTEKSAIVSKLEQKESTVDSPLLYDLTALQKDANKKYGLSADTTLSIAQKLYEAKLITYPRTGSRYISLDVYEILPILIGSLQNCYLPLLSGAAEQVLAIPNLYKRSVNDSKVTDHHALLVTENNPTSLTGDDERIYLLIATRMLEAVSFPCKKDVTLLEMECGGVSYKTKGEVITFEGWRGIRREQDKTEEGDSIQLPFLLLGEDVLDTKVELLEKKTKPKGIHTESSLLSAMESAGKEIECEEERLALKEVGLGTPATRAAIIEKLFSMGYIKREKKALLPTEKGLEVFSITKDMRISDVVMTGSWENALAKVESGEIMIETFSQQIEIHTAQITRELLGAKVNTTNTSNGGERKEFSMFQCPKCKKQSLKIYPKIAKCETEGCDFKVFKTVAGKILSDKQIQELVSKGKTSLIKGFKSKNGNNFDASIGLKNDFTTEFLFPPKK